MANAFAALGGFEQVDELRSLSEDCLKYLSFESDRIDLGDYWKIIGFDLTISELSQCRNSKWKFANRSFRLVTSNPNGPIVRGFATNEEHGDLVIHLLLTQLSPEDCVNLARRLLLNSDDLGSANIPGITFYPIAEPGMSFFAPRPWN